MSVSDINIYLLWDEKDGSTGLDKASIATSPPSTVQPVKWLRAAQAAAHVARDAHLARQALPHGRALGVPAPAVQQRARSEGGLQDC